MASMNTNLSVEIEEEAIRLYQKARTGVPEGTPVCLLHIDDAYTIASYGHRSDTTETVWMFSIGRISTAHDFFSDFPPTPAEIEEAIMVVEDEVMPLRKLLDNNIQLFTFDTCIREIAAHVETIAQASPTELSIREMEQVFTRLAAIITGRPASSDTLPLQTSFAATLLILREFMHHLGFKKIIIL
jgi:hypothetical protein